METFAIEVGRLLCRNVRDILGSEALYRPSLRWYESSGWIERTFTIAGDKADVDAVADRLRYYVECVNAVSL